MTGNEAPGGKPIASERETCEHDYTVIALDYLGGKIELPVKAENAFVAVDMAIADKRVHIVVGIVHHKANG